MINNIKKYDVWLIDLDPIKWNEQSWTRPCLVYQSNMISKYTNTYIIIPITSKEKRKSPITVIIEDYKKCWLSKISVILSFQIRTVSKERFIKKIWSIESKELRIEINKTVKMSLDLDDDFINEN